MVVLLHSSRIYLAQSVWPRSDKLITNRRTLHHQELCMLHPTGHTTYIQGNMRWQKHVAHVEKWEAHRASWAESFMGRDHPGDLEKDGWMMINLVLRISMCDVICRSVVSSGGLFEHGDELPDFTKAWKLFASSLIIDFLPAILFRGWTTHESWICGRGKRFSSSPRGSDQRSNASSLYSIVIWGSFAGG
jgi:hypothetical protein